MRKGARVGLFGGSFNPAHGGHRRMSVGALARLGLDEVWWLVSPQNPLKARVGMAPLAARLARARAVARHPRIRPTAIEQRLGTRYTCDTIRRLRQIFPDVRFVWLMGSDNLLQFHRWANWRGIARLVPIVVIARAPAAGPAHYAPAMGWLRRFRHQPAQGWAGWRPPAIGFLHLGYDRRSATAIRRTTPDWAIPGGATSHPSASEHSL